MQTRHQTDVMTAIGAVSDRVSALAAAIKEMVVAECLHTATVIIGGAGYVEYDYPATFASVALTNCSEDTITATTATPADTAPVRGTGVVIVPAGKGAVYNLSSHSLTLYGTPGGQVVVSVFSRPQPPAWG
jgi:hypothetical protein